MCLTDEKISKMQKGSSGLLTLLPKLCPVFEVSLVKPNFKLQSCLTWSYKKPENSKSGHITRKINDDYPAYLLIPLTVCLTASLTKFRLATLRSMTSVCLQAHKR